MSENLFFKEILTFSANHYLNYQHYNPNNLNDCTDCQTYISVDRPQSDVSDFQPRTYNSN